MDVVRAERVSKRFSHKAVLRGIDLDLRVGEVLCVVGPNGTGKSTLLRVLAGTYLPDEGTVTLNGTPTSQAAARCQVATSYNDDRSWYGRLSLWENLRFWQSLRGPFPGQAEELLHQLDLQPSREVPVAVLSSGQRARLGVVRALLADTPVVALDEPTRGVDTAASAAVADVLLSVLAEGRVVVVATHDDQLRARLGGRTMTLSLGETP